MSAWPEPFSFGALPLPDGRTRFRLWAPTAAPGLALVIEGRAPIALHPDAQGYAQVDVDCGAGTRYRYRLGDGTLVPDPASRLQQDDVHGASIVTGADAYPGGIRAGAGGHGKRPCCTKSTPGWRAATPACASACRRWPNWASPCSN